MPIQPTPGTELAVPGTRTPAEIPKCVHCGQPVVPCQCRLIDGDRCSPPFRGLVHLMSNSHLCSFPQPGASFAERVADNG